MSRDAPDLGSAPPNGDVTSFVHRGSVRARLELLPVTRSRRQVGPYDFGGQVGVRLIVPVLRDERIKDLITLGLFVFNDLSLEQYYGAATGRVWHAGKLAVGAANLGEAGATVRFGLALFDAATIHISAGAGLPVWPSPTDIHQVGPYFAADVNLP